MFQSYVFWIGGGGGFFINLLFRTFQGVCGREFGCEYRVVIVAVVLLGSGGTQTHLGVISSKMNNLMNRMRKCDLDGFRC